MVAFTKHDLQFIFDGISVSESHAAQTNAVVGDVWTVSDLETSRQVLLSLIPNAFEPIGMRTISGELNNLVADQGDFGATGEFPRLLDPNFINEGDDQITLGPGGPLTNNDFGAAGDVVDADPRIISNLIVDQTINNPVALNAALNLAGVEDVATALASITAAFEALQANPTDQPTIDAYNGELDAWGVTADLDGLLTIENTAPDEGLSAGFNSWMTLFGQFFDHGLDLVAKGGNGTVYIPLEPDDPLFVQGSQTNFMALTRTTLNDNGEATNFTSPFVDQNQTYTSHPSHQIFVREYAMDGNNQPQSTGSLIEGANGTGMATWGDVKAQAANMLGIELTDNEAVNIPLFAVDQYGEFLRGANGLPQFVIGLRDAGDVLVGTTLVEGNLANPVSVSEAIAAAAPLVPAGGSANVNQTGFAFLVDIAHTANPHFSDGTARTADSNTDIGHHLEQTSTQDGLDMANNQGPTRGGSSFYDNELFDAHFIAGDGRANENFGLTAVHHVFHQEHNRLVEHIKEVLVSNANNIDLSTVDDPAGSDAALALLNGYLVNPVATFPANQAEIDALVWDGDRLFQAAKFGTEMEYQHLVFEEFGRKVQPLIDIFASYETTIDAKIVAEFAHTVYRFGHSMLTESVDLMDETGNLTEAGLIEAFLNPLGFNHLVNADGSVDAGDELAQDSSTAAAAIVRGMTRQSGNEIDEFVTEALRNNLVGLPLDLAAINIARGRETGIPTLNEARADFFAGTSDAKLRPYDSWVDFALNLKNGGASIVNFIAAYGTHDLIARQDTLEAKRAAAMALTTGDDTDIAALDGAYVVGDIADRLDFLNAQGTHAGGDLGGLNNVDFWIGGLAEAIEPFGGMLGSTFNFVFEQQMEDLQDGDRFYYLGRTGGLNFVTQLEQNSFAAMIVRNTDIGDNGADHLPGDIFSTPTWILEVDQSRQITGLGDPALVAALAAAQAEFDAADAAFDTAFANDAAADQNITDTIAAALADAVITPAETAAINAAIAAAAVTQGALIAAQATLDTETTELAAATAAAAAAGNNGDPTNDDANPGQLNPFLDLGAGSNPLVIRTDPNGSGDNYLQYTGGDHVVLGGTEQRDILVGGIGDDTLWGDGGDDDLNGGDGSDILLGGAGDDLIIDIGGEDNIQGQDGNDVISAGGGIDLILAGAGQDFVLQGPDFAETFGGTGNDFINAGAESNIIFGGEGNDWLEGGEGNNLLQGDNGDPFLNSTITGHDVFIAGAGDDDYDSESGDDIMLGGPGIQRFEGLNGFDWASYARDTDGVEADFFLQAFNEAPLPPGPTTIMDRFDQTEGLSGSAFGDILRGGDEDGITNRTVNNGGDNVLRNFDLIQGLRQGDFNGDFNATALFDGATTEWGEGDIILGGGGSDLIEGRGGNDIIDGDLNLNVRLLARDPNSGDAVATADEMNGALFQVDPATGVPLLDTNGARIAVDPNDFGGATTLNAAMLNRAINPGNLEIVREILDNSDVNDFDTVEYTGNITDYTINPAANALGFISVTDNVGLEGSDLLRGIERLVFADQVVDLAGGNTQATGQPSILDEATQLPVALVAVGQLLEATPGNIADADFNPPGLMPAGTTVTYQWQFEEEAGSGAFVDFEIVNAAGEVGPLRGKIIEVPAEATGVALRVRAQFRDGDNVIETVFSNATATVGATIVDQATNGDDLIIGTNAGETIDALAGDDEIRAAGGNDILIGGPGNDILDGGTGFDTASFGGPLADFTLTFDAEGNLEVVDDGAATEDLAISIESFAFSDQTLSLEAARAAVAPDDAPTGADDIIIGTAGDDAGTNAQQLRAGAGNDTVIGQAGNDDIRGQGGNDILIGGLDNDVIRSGAGDDTIIWNANVDGFQDDGRDEVRGGNQGEIIGDTFVVNGNDTDEDFHIFSAAEATIAGLAFANGTEIVITRNGMTNADVIAELRGIEEIVINGGAGTDTFTPHGNFNGTALSTSTITINGSEGDDVVDLSQITSAHRILFRSNGGRDMIVGDLRPQDVIELAPGLTIDDYTGPNYDGNGMWTLSHNGGGHSISYAGGGNAPQPTFVGQGDQGEFLYTQTDLNELLKLVRGQQSELAEEHATGIRDLEGTGNNLANPDFGSADQPFIRLTDARYGAEILNDNGYVINRDISPIFNDLDPRDISNALGHQEADLAKSAAGANIFFMAFGQYFDHGLDFLPKGGNGTIEIGHDPDDNPADLTRGSVDYVDQDGIPHHLNKTSPFVDQNQAYGSTELVGQFLREGDGNGGLGAKLLSGALDPTNPDFALLPTLRELILHHWDNNTVFEGVPGGTGPDFEMSFRDYFTDLPYMEDPENPGVFFIDTLVDGAGNISNNLVSLLNQDFMGSGHTLVGDANPFIDVLDHYVSGDLRANENFALTSMHTVWARNHNFHVDRLDDAGFVGNAEELFQAAKIVNESEYQRVVFDEFADKLLGGLKGSGSHGHDDYNPAVDARISHEFAGAAYRFGHSLIGQTITVMENGQEKHVALTDAFLNPTNDAEAFNQPLAQLAQFGYVPQPGFEQYGPAQILEGIAGQQAEEVDYNIVDAVRNDLVRIRADLFAFNVARGWDIGLGTLNQVKQGLLKSNDPYVKEAISLSGANLSPYTTWQDFATRNGLSAAVLLQFMAAYPDLVLADGEIEAFELANPDIELVDGNTVKGIDRVDFWVGGLAEQHINDGMVGATFWVVLHEQFDRLQEGDRFYYLDRVDDFAFYQQVEEQSFADIVARNTGLDGLPDDIFSVDADNTDDAGDEDQLGEEASDNDDNDIGPVQDITDSVDDVGDTDNVGDDSDGDTPVSDDVEVDNVPLQDGPAASFAGDIVLPTAAVQPLSLIGGDDADTLIGGDANDVAIGGGGADNIVSGLGDDVVDGGTGDDIIIAGTGDDHVIGGDGDDVVLASEGNDWINGGAGRDVVNAGLGDDIIVAKKGDGNDVYRGEGGNDTLDMAAVSAAVTVDLGLGTASSADIGADTLSGIENVITGEGDDLIIADSSANVLTGGDGEDVFRFNSVAAADGDHITDFAPGDRIDLTGIAAELGLDNNQFELVSGTTLSQAGQIVVRSDGDDLLVEGEADGEDGADFAIRVSGKSDLDPGDFGS